MADCASCSRDGAAVPADTTVRLALGERSGTVDLCLAHASGLRETFEPLLDAAARRERRRPERSTTARLLPHEDRETIRGWARSQGLPVSTSGGISLAVLERYRAAGQVVGA